MVCKYIILRDIRRTRRILERLRSAIPRDYGQCYQQKSLFTKNEYWELRKLIPFAKANNMEILAKVRLLDLIEPRTPYKNNKKLIRKVWAKHVDFVITDSTYNVITIIELDDNSHYRPDRVERDQFVNAVSYKKDDKEEARAGTTDG